MRLRSLFVPILTAAGLAAVAGAGAGAEAGPAVAAAAGAPVAPAPHASTSQTAPAYGPEERAAIDAIVGTTPPEWNVERWLNSPPLTLAGLRGKVVLVRWWTAGCPYCSATAPALRALHHDFAPKGLVVVGMYHHKDKGPYDPQVTVSTAKEYGFTFPIAFDPDWRTFHAWMNGADSGWTSVTFLLDKKGVVRWFHPGGTYKPGDAAETELRRTVTALLSAP